MIRCHTFLRSITRKGTRKVTYKSSISKLGFHDWITRYVACLGIGTNNEADFWAIKIGLELDG
ncbi:hypothetical protein SLEP1_g18513 [Rubroshorea leprosula]|uniref:Homing endonuclease LAGLIDADG domain-containing protein n=1 Tax=Rubroshorea leprosula TaxID=152421 RepID=A0AAV5J3M5_9ROSI|nr:hypothetical protein SLEP1_g18513 [Rubroshorea leprosula]